jgi:hypothetical protein
MFCIEAKRSIVKIRDNANGGKMKIRKMVAVDGENYEVSDEFLSYVLETAVEGACSYWADIEAESDGSDTRNSNGRNFDISEYADEDENEDMVDDEAVTYTAASFLVSKDPAQGGTLDLEGIADAIERIAGNEVTVPPAIRDNIVAAVRDDDVSEIDAEAADCIVQIGLFDEIAYS